MFRPYPTWAHSKPVMKVSVKPACDFIPLLSLRGTAWLEKAPQFWM